jgi:BirA family transcriptional regulator, biotin operon repressor / biotin---[acetyl-CoA-carboxylase] ligase
MTTTTALNLPAIRRQLTASAIGRHLYLFGDVDSTNARLACLARAGARAGTVLMAEGQAAARGCHGKVWFSPSGVNLYVSVLLRPRIWASEVGAFSLLGALTLADTVKEFGAAPTITCSNEVLVDGKKLGASVVECGRRGEKIDYVVVGVGVNLNVELSELRAALGPDGTFATALAAMTGHEIDRNAFAAAYLNHFDRWNYVWEMQGAEGFITAWRRRQATLDHRDVLVGDEAGILN